MAILIDTSILCRLANTSDQAYPVAWDAVTKLRSRGEILHLTPQVLIEFRNVATRSVPLNGLGYAPTTASGFIAGYESSFSM